MRIAYVTRQLPPSAIGGIGTYVQTVSRMLAAAGHEVTVVNAAPGQARSTTREGGVTIERFPVVGPAWLWRRLDRRSALAASRVHAACSAFAALRRLGKRFDVIEAPEWKAEGLLLRLARKGAVIVHLHLSQELVQLWNEQPRGRFRIAERLERLSASLAHEVSACSMMTITAPDGTSWLPQSDVTLVAPPLLTEPWTRCPPVVTTDPVVLFMGHLEHRKAPDLLLRALGQLASEVPSLRVSFVGRPFRTKSGVPFDEELHALGRELGIDCEVRGPSADIDEVLGLYGAARVVAVPSRFETLSMVALEAFASGRPAVMTDRVGAAEWIAPHVPRAVVPFGDVDALAAALRPLLKDAAAAVEVGMAGKTAVEEICSRTAIVESRVAVYRAAMLKSGQ